MPPNHSQIKAYAEELRTKCAEFERTANKEKMQELSRKLAHYKLSSLAKAHAILSKQHKDYANLCDQVKREIESSSSSGGNSGNVSSLSSSSDSLETLKLEEESRLNDIATVSPSPASIPLKMGVG